MGTLKGLEKTGPPWVARIRGSTLILSVDQHNISRYSLSRVFLTLGFSNYRIFCPRTNHKICKEIGLACKYFRDILSIVHFVFTAHVKN